MNLFPLPPYENSQKKRASVKTMSYGEGEKMWEMGKYFRRGTPLSFAKKTHPGGSEKSEREE